MYPQNKQNKLSGIYLCCYCETQKTLNTRKSQSGLTKLSCKQQRCLFYGFWHALIFITFGPRTINDPEMCSRFSGLDDKIEGTKNNKYCKK